MTYWRMQLHPSQRPGAVKHTVDCLSAGYVGLDFAADVPDLLTVEQAALPENQRAGWHWPAKPTRSGEAVVHGDLA